jgi:hypothetical protein
MEVLIHRLPNGTPVGAWKLQNGSPVSYYIDPIRRAYGASVVRVTDQESWDMLTESLLYSANPTVRWTTKEIEDDAQLSSALQDTPRAKE